VRSLSKVDRAVLLPLTAETLTVSALHRLAGCFMNSKIYEQYMNLMQQIASLVVLLLYQELYWDCVAGLHLLSCFVQDCAPLSHGVELWA
jgi:hypothetical protein